MKKRLFLSTICFFLICWLSFPFQAFSIATQNRLYREKPAKYVFLIIGDGMGIAQRALTEAFLNTRNSKDERGGLLMNRLPAHGITTTRAANRFITDSAAAGTAIASGHKTNFHYIGLDPDLRPLESIAVKAKRKGMRVGIISSVSLDHATPASFYAHQPHREMYYEISLELASSGFDFFGGGGLIDPWGRKAKNPRGNAFKKAVKNGYRIVERKRRFMSLPENFGKVIAVNRRRDSKEALPYNIDRRADDITLAEFTRKAIELLDNPKGFFLMVEGGKIDWAAHANDAATLIQEVLSLDEALKEAWNFYRKHPDETLIVVTADHETGGLSLGFAGTKYDSFFEVLKSQKISFNLFKARVKNYRKAYPRDLRFEYLLPDFRKYFGFCVKCEGIMKLKNRELGVLKVAFKKSMAGSRSANPDYSEYLIYGSYSYDPLTIVLTRTLARKAGINWTTYSHTGVPVATSAAGVGAETFNGYYDNTDIAKKIMAVMKVK